MAISTNLLNDFYVFALAHFIAAIGPGIGSFYVITKTIIHGKKVGTKSACTIALTDTFYASLVIFGVSGIVKTNPALYRCIEIFCAFYLFFLCFRITQSSFEGGKLKSFEKSLDKDKKFIFNNVYISAFITAILNVRIFILYLSLLSDPLESVDFGWKIFYFAWILIVNILCYNLLKLCSLNKIMRGFLLSKMAILNIAFAIILFISAIKLLILG
ncbi:Putative aminoacid transport protein [Candidatus Deianiraea vastatrix]|uniref:Aminoacid transport protein n=2 Tax=Candidatus Deianiraea vastatrix TaxID=2163644 RepID=A0A5B8XCX0_9RICK|nr:Putative aminoacid transport protein [Candidatus Deianiraea vastatrix]